jgi:tRNA U34 5-methylaminomethyl-2-thiouridine-forming methyltransferase MnmC
MDDAGGQDTARSAAGATAAQATADGSRTLHSERFGEAFHSVRGAVTEARHIFLDSSGIRERLAARQPAAILEVGFGLGLNFSLSAELALDCGADLHYVAFERELLAASELAGLDYGRFAPRVWPALLQWRSQLPGRLPGAPLNFSISAGSSLVELQVIPGDASRLLTSDSCLQLPSGAFAGPFDAVYQDAFSPAVNPELWSPAFLQGLLKLLRVDGRLVTYSVSGRVRRSLQELGASVSKQPGPAGGKRQMLLAVKLPARDSAPGDQ